MKLENLDKRYLEKQLESQRKKLENPKFDQVKIREYIKELETELKKRK